MLNEDAKHLLEGRGAADQDPIQALCAERAHEPLRNAVGLWRASRRPNDLNPVSAEHVIKIVGVFLIR